MKKKSFRNPVLIADHSRNKQEINVIIKIHIKVDSINLIINL